MSQAWLLQGTDEQGLPVARTKRQAEALAIMMEMTAEQEAAAVAVLKGISAHLAKK